MSKLESVKEARMTTMRIAKHIPKRQQRQRNFLGRAKFGAKAIRQAMIVLTQHFIFVFNMGDECQHEGEVHVLDLQNCSTDGDTFILKCRNGKELSFSSANMGEYKECVLRNWALSCGFRWRDCLPVELYRTVGWNASQRFVFTVLAAGSKFEKRVDSDVVKYYHSVLASMRYVVDINEIPLRKYTYNGKFFRDDLELLPLSYGWRKSPYLSVFVAESMRQPELIENAVCGILRATQLKVIVLKDLCATRGGAMWKALWMSRPGSGLAFVDISNNKLKDAFEFVEAIRWAPETLRGLVLENMGMNAQVVLNLLSNLLKNVKLNRLEELRIAGNEIGRNAREIMWSLFAVMPTMANRAFPLRILSIGKMAEPEHVINSLIGVKGTLETLEILDSELSDAACGSLIRLTKETLKLRRLSLEGCTVDRKNLKKLMTAIAGNTGIPTIYLSLARIKNVKRVLKHIVDGLNSGFGAKLDGLDMSGQHWMADDFALFNKYGGKLSILRKLSLSGTLLAEWIGTGELVEKFLRSLKFLESIDIAGDDKCRLGAACEQVVFALCHLRKLKHIGLRDNMIGEKGLKGVVALIMIEGPLESIDLDGDDLRSGEALVEYINACAESKSLVDVTYPAKDIVDVLRRDAADSTGPNLQTALANLNDALIAKRGKKGIKSRLSLRGDSVLNSILDDPPVGRPKLPELSTKLGLWSILEEWGVPMPFDTQTMPTEKGNISIRCAADDGEIGLHDSGDDFVAEMIRNSDKDEGVFSAMKSLPDSPMLAWSAEFGVRIPGTNSNSGGLNLELELAKDVDSETNQSFSDCNVLNLPPPLQGALPPPLVQEPVKLPTSSLPDHAVDGPVASFVNSLFTQSSPAALVQSHSTDSLSGENSEEKPAFQAPFSFAFPRVNRDVPNILEPDISWVISPEDLMTDESSTSDGFGVVSSMVPDSIVPSNV